MTRFTFEKNESLFGVDSTPGIVAVESVSGDKMRLFLRQAGQLAKQDQIFTPFVFLEEEELLQGFKEPHRVEPLTSSNTFRFLVLFENWNVCEKAREHLRKATGRSASSPHAPYLYLSDPVHQFLLLTGKTLFKGLSFKDLHRLAIDIETGCAPGFEFSNPQREEDRILSIALMDNRGYAEVLFGMEMGEKEMIRTLGERIVDVDPDVLEGHNLFNFDLEYIVARARMHRIKLPWGRDGSQPRIRTSRFTVAERIIDYTRMDIFGRHVVDTMFMLQYYDVTARELESYGLKSAAIHFGLSDEERTYVNREKIQWTYEHDPEALKRYNLDDVRETLALSELLGYPFFLQTQIFPFSYQNIFIRGNATKINSLFVREYLRRRASIPKPIAKGDFEGGYTDVFVEGVVKDVVHCDVASLYPSIMISFNLKPAGDTLDIFLPLLRHLRGFRLEAKRKAQEVVSSHEREYYQALQQTFKLLINSFYGYLGTTLHHFSDPALAAEVTRLGREIIRKMLDWLEHHGAKPVEIDTDGIYFVPPSGVVTEDQAKELISRLSDSLPEGIDVEMDGKYASMFSYKKKNYALLDEAGKMVIRGSGLRSRGIEKYLREFLSALLRCLLEERGQQVHYLFDDYNQRLVHHNMDIGLLAKTETLTESPENYQLKIKAKKRNRAAAYELALSSGRDFRAGDQVSYYITGSGKKVRAFENCKFASSYDPAHPDENIEYYRARLLDMLKKFHNFLPPKV
jgi:DNA polymerase, archaea type